MAKNKYVQGKDGKFKGSIGSGKTRTPKAAPALPALAPGVGPNYKAYGPDERLSCRFQAVSGKEVAELVARANDTVAYAIVSTENFGGGKSQVQILFGEHRTPLETRHFLTRAHGLAFAAKKIVELVGLPPLDTEEQLPKIRLVARSARTAQIEEVIGRLRTFLTAAEDEMSEHDWVDKTTAFATVDLPEAGLRTILTADLEEDEPVWTASVESQDIETGVYYELDNEEFFSKEEALEWSRKEILDRFREKTAFEFRYAIDRNAARESRKQAVEALEREAQWYRREASQDPFELELGFQNRMAKIVDSGDVFTVVVNRRNHLRGRDVILHQMVFDTYDDALAFGEEMTLIGN